MEDDIKVIIAELRKDIDYNQKAAVEYRSLLCEKVGELKAALIKIGEKLSELPCKERKEIYKNLSLWAKLQWVALGGVFTLLAIHLKWR